MITDEKMLRVYTKFQETRRAKAEARAPEKILMHDDYTLPTSHHLSCLVFGQMACDFTRSLIGEVNRFFVCLDQADCWIEVANDHEESEKLNLLSEFADPLLELSVGRPHSLRDHFSFAAFHLLYQSKSRRGPQLNDKLPSDRKIDYSCLLRQKNIIGAGWGEFPKFMEKLSQLNDPNLIDGTHDFRNWVQHRFRLHSDTGLTPCFERRTINSGVAYNYVVIPPLNLKTLIPALYAQHEISVGVFKAYWNLLNEMRSSLSRKVKSNTAT